MRFGSSMATENKKGPVAVGPLSAAFAATMLNRFTWQCERGIKFYRLIQLKLVSFVDPAQQSTLVMFYRQLLVLVDLYLAFS